MIINPYVAGGEAPPPEPFSYSNTGGSGNRNALTGFEVITNGSLAAGTIPKICDGVFAANTSGAYRWSSGQSGIYVRYDFGAGHAVEIDQWRFTQSAGGFSSGGWRWQFSDDDSVWTTCSNTVTMNTTGVTWDATITSPHRYYRRSQVSGTTSSGPWQEEDEFRIRGY